MDPHSSEKRRVFLFLFIFFDHAKNINLLTFQHEIWKIAKEILGIIRFTPAGKIIEKNNSGLVKTHLIYYAYLRLMTPLDLATGCYLAFFITL